MPSSKLTKGDILRLLELLDTELAAQQAEGELYVVGGAVMCLAFDARAATRDVAALFKPTRIIREAAGRVAAKAGIEESWLNDAVKGYLSPRGEFDPFLELPHLKVFIAQPRYLLAMKCAAIFGREDQGRAVLERAVRFQDEEGPIEQQRTVIGELTSRGRLGTSMPSPFRVSIFKQRVEIRREHARVRRFDNDAVRIRRRSVLRKELSQ